MVKALPGETSPFMMKVSEKCPFLHVRNPAATNASAVKDGVPPADPEKANCVVEENYRMDMSDMFKVCLVLTEDILVEDNTQWSCCVSMSSSKRKQGGKRTHL